MLKRAFESYSRNEKNTIQARPRLIPHLDEPCPTGTSIGGTEYEHAQIPARHATPLPETNRSHSGCRRLGAGFFGALHLARHGRYQVAVDRAVEPFRPGIRQMVRSVCK